MFFSDNVLEDVRSANDIVELISGYVSLKKKGGNYFGLCPFHRESTPSFSVSADKQMYYCFGCGAGGNIFTFLMQKENFDFSEAVTFLADKAHYTLPDSNVSNGEAKRNAEIRNILYDIHTDAARFFYSLLTSEAGREAVEYLDKRGVSGAVRKKFGLGYAIGRMSLFEHLSAKNYDTDMILKSGLVIREQKSGKYYDRFFNRVMFPIFNVQNKIIGFGGRIIGQGEPKYLNSPDTPIFDKSRNLYALNYARSSNVQSIIIVEGYMDVIALFQNGIQNVVASLGTAFNPEHAKLLKKYRENAILLFDSDEAGEKAALRAIPILVSNGLKTKVVQLKDAKDPDEFIKSFGIKAFAGALSGAMDYMAFQIQCKRKNFDISDTAQRIQFTYESAKLMSELDNAIEREAYIKEMSQMTGISADSIKKEVEKLSGDTFSVADQYKKRHNIYAAADGGKKAEEARNGIIYALSADRAIAEAVKQHLSPEEMLVPFYIRLFNVIYDMYNNKQNERQNIYHAEVVNYFEDVEQQKMVTNVFRPKFEFEDKREFIKSLNDQIKVIKEAYIDNKIRELWGKSKRDSEKMNDSEELDDSKKMDVSREIDIWALAKRNLKNSYITGLDG